MYSAHCSLRPRLLLGTSLSLLQLIRNLRSICVYDCLAYVFASVKELRYVLCNISALVSARMDFRSKLLIGVRLVEDVLLFLLECWG